MSSELSRAEVGQIATLARLELSEAEVELFARQLGDILVYARQVQKVDTTGVLPTSSVISTRAADRADAVQPPLERDRALEQAPDVAPGTGFFRVPRVLG